MSITKRDLIEDLEPFDDETKLVVRDPQGNLVAVRGTAYEPHPSRDDYVLVLDTRRSARGRRT